MTYLWPRSFRRKRSRVTFSWAARLVLIFPLSAQHAPTTTAATAPTVRCGCSVPTLRRWRRRLETLTTFQRRLIIRKLRSPGPPLRALLSGIKFAHDGLLCYCVCVGARGVWGRFGSGLELARKREKQKVR